MIRPSKGFVLLYVMIVVAAVTVSLSLSSALASTFAGNRLRSYAQGAEVRMLAAKCAEVVLLRVRANVALAETSSLTYGTGSCSYTVSGTSPAKTIVVTANQYNLMRRLTIVTTQVAPVILSTWTEGP